MVKKNIINLILFLIICYGSFLTLPLESAYLHVILVGDSLNDHDPTGFEGGVDLWRRETKRIAAYAGLELNGVIFEGHQCRLQNVLNYIDNLSIQEDDAVILYFAMHGSRESNKENQWPDLSFSLDKQKVDFDLFNQRLKEKNPRLLLSVADSCNNVVNTRQNPEQEDTLANAFEEEEESFQQFNNTRSFTSLLITSTSDELIQKYRRLFIDHSGSIVVSTSSPGQFSIKHCVTGGIFTTQLIETLRKKARCPIQEIQWNDLLSDVTARTTHKVENLKNELALEESQIPQFELDLHESIQ